MIAQNMLRTYKGKLILLKNNFEFDDTFDVTKCLKQIDLPDLFHMCAPCAKLPSNITEMC